MAYNVQTRAQHRDQVRRLMSIIPPIDQGVGVAGALPTRWPKPTNPNINMQLDFAIAWLDGECQLGGDATPISYPVAAQTGLNPGPFTINLQAIAPLGSINDIYRVSWIDGSGTNEDQLISRSREELDRYRMQEMTSPTGTPIYYWVEHGSLMVWPSPDANGTLFIMAGKALWSQSQQIDNEVIELIPSTYWPLVDALTVSLICAQQPMDMVLQGLKQSMDQIVSTMLPNLKRMINRRNRNQQSFIRPGGYRTGGYGYGGRR